MPLFGENEMLICVGMSLGRLLRPFEYFVRVLLSWDIIRKAADLEDVTTAQINCKQPNDTTGPTSITAYPCATHVKEARAHGPWEW